MILLDLVFRVRGDVLFNLKGNAYLDFQTDLSQKGAGSTAGGENHFSISIADDFEKKNNNKIKNKCSEIVNKP